MASRRDVCAEGPVTHAVSKQGVNVVDLNPYIDMCMINSLIQLRHEAKNSTPFCSGQVEEWSHLASLIEDDLAGAL